MANTRSCSRNTQPTNPPQVETTQNNPEPPPPPPEEPQEGNVSDTASSPHTVPKNKELVTTKIPILDSDIVLLQKTQESILRRLENNEKRNDLQRQEDLRVMQQMMEDRMENPKKIKGRRQREYSPEEPEESPPQTDSPSPNRRTRSRHRDQRHRDQSRTFRQSDQHRPRMSASEAKRIRLGKIPQDKEGYTGKRARKSPEGKKSRSRRSPEEYRMKFLDDDIQGPFSEEIASAPYPKRLDLTHLPKYDRSQDPRVHLETFEVGMWA